MFHVVALLQPLVAHQTLGTERVRQVTLEEATAKSQQLNIMFMETSAKAGHNVKSLFKKIAMSLPGMEKDNQNADAANTSTSAFGLSHPIVSVRLVDVLAQSSHTHPTSNISLARNGADQFMDMY